MPRPGDRLRRRITGSEVLGSVGILSEVMSGRRGGHSFNIMWRYHFSWGATTNSPLQRWIQLIRWTSFADGNVLGANFVIAVRYLWVPLYLVRGNLVVSCIVLLSIDAASFRRRKGLELADEVSRV